VVNGTSENQLMAERLESLKAAMIGGLCLAIAFTITSLGNHLVLSQYFTTLSRESIDLHWVLSGGIAAFCGLLFGVTYRYIIRSDKNPQLKAGGVLAFGLVRGLTQVDVGLSVSGNIFPFVILGGESILWFGLAAFALEAAIQVGWVKTFVSS
jgi:hypothetical protein